MDVMDEWSLPEAEAELTPHCVQGEDEEDEDEEEDEQTRDEPSSFTNPSIRSHTGVISSVCSTSQWKLKCVRCVCVFGPHLETSQHLDVSFRTKTCRTQNIEHIY